MKDWRSWLPRRKRQADRLVGTGPFVFREYRPGSTSDERNERSGSGEEDGRVRATGPETGSALLILGLVLVLNFILFRMMPGTLWPHHRPELLAEAERG